MYSFHDIDQLFFPVYISYMYKIQLINICPGLKEEDGYHHGDPHPPAQTGGTTGSPPQTGS